MVVKEYDSPCGLLYMASIGHHLCLCSWQGIEACHRYLRNHGKIGMRDNSDYKEEWEVISRAVKELEEYFNGERQTFDIPLRMFGTEFQKRVWDTLLTVPYGDTVSYKHLAHMLGAPGSAMAVAKACAKNPIAIFIPGHRVVGHDGKVTGYAASVAVRQKLIDLERSEKMVDALAEA